MTRIAYFGPQGTFTEQAALRVIDPSTDELFPVETIPAALDAVREGSADAACVPIENSVEGAVTITMDALAAGEPVVAVAEVVLPVAFSILVRPGTRPEDVTTVASIPIALAQVRDWLAEHLPKAEHRFTNSTAASAVAVLNGEFDAAVTAPVAATHYPLDVLATEVADVSDAKTRFLLFRRPGPLPAPTGADRTSLIVFTADRTGALSDVLVELARAWHQSQSARGPPDQGQAGRVPVLPRLRRARRRGAGG